MVKEPGRMFIENVLDLEVQTAQELNDMFVHFSENKGLASEDEYFGDMLQAFASWRAASHLAERELATLIAARISADAAGAPWDF